MTGFLHNWGPTLVAAGAATLVAVTGAVLTKLDSWYYNLRKPSWQPPDWLFGPAWTVIFICAATAGVIGWRAVPGSSSAALLVVEFVANSVLNILWSVFFFTRHRPDFALREVPFLWASIVAIMLTLHEYAGWAWVFMVPYLLWVSFATFLNYTIVRLNAPFHKAA